MLITYIGLSLSINKDMGSSAEHVKLWRKTSKERIVNSFGGSCGICGYSRCLDALELHHLNPSEKDFTLSRIRANPKSWDKIVAELRKCVMLCSICHREVHAGLRHIPLDCRKYDESFSDYKKQQHVQQFDTCPICSKQKFIYNKTCSTTCGSTLRESYEWEKFDLFQLYIVEKWSMLKIAQHVGCSDVAVAKRLKKLKLK